MSQEPSSGTTPPSELTIDEAVERLAVIEGYDPGDGPQPCVHTFRVGMMMLGAHWSVEDARAAFEEFGVKETDDSMMVGMNHRLVVRDKTSDVFFETKPR